MTIVRRSPIWAMPKEKFQELVSRSSSLGEILKHFNLENKGGNPKTLKTRLKEDDIDFSHIQLGYGANIGRVPHNFQQTPLSELTVENSSYNRTSLKKRLICEGILKNVCSECGQEGSWCGKPLKMVLDHINGVPNDNRIENLRMLCPNCNSQTDTFAGKNKRIRD